MKSLARVKVDKLPQYYGPEWDRKINSPDNPNFWKYGVADLIFLDHVKDKKLVLDLGCGTGNLALFLASKIEAQWIIGVDLVKDMVNVAKKKAADRGLEKKTCFLVCDGRYLPFKSSFFDGLISRGDAFCFLVPLKSAVQELKRVMKPGGVTVLEMDNRVDWKPGTTISTSFQKTTDEKIAYVVATFTKKRNYRAVSYILDPIGRIAKDVAGDPEFQEKGCKPSECSLQKVKKESTEIRQGVPTHWPSSKELTSLFKRGGFTEVHVIGDGLLMKLLLDGDPAIVEAMKKNPQLFFEIERRLVLHVNPTNAPTIILRAIAP